MMQGWRDESEIEVSDEALPQSKEMLHLYRESMLKDYLLIL